MIMKPTTVATTVNCSPLGRPKNTSRKSLSFMLLTLKERELLCCEPTEYPGLTLAEYTKCSKHFRSHHRTVIERYFLSINQYGLHDSPCGVYWAPTRTE